MTPEERRVRLQAILDAHDNAAREFRESTEAIRAGEGALSARLADASAAINKATAAMMAANRAALALFNEDDREATP